MPYEKGQHLSGERASRLGHLDVLKSELVKRLCERFEDPTAVTPGGGATWEPIPAKGEQLPLVFAVDGSLQVIESVGRISRALAFVKTALLRVDRHALTKVDKDSPNPFTLRDILADSALYHATVFPLRHVTVPGLRTYDAVRQIVFESLKDASLSREPLETLKWIAYEKWSGGRKTLPLFDCPTCRETVATLHYDEEEGTCPGCGGHLYLTDMLGFHQEMAHESAPDSVASAYMMIHETLLLFTGVRYFWEKNRKVLSECLFIKDGPLSIRAQYSKLVTPLRRLFTASRQQGCKIHVLGQEKTGAFVDHLQLIGSSAADGTLFVPGDRYIKEEIQHRPDTGAPYGIDTNYGAKVFVRLNNLHQMVLNIPTCDYVQNPTISDLIGADRILATLPTILSSRFEGGLFPIELVHGVASLSTYPSAHILKVFAETTLGN